MDNADRLVKAKEWKELRKKYGLSGRELSVLRLTFRGLRRKEIRQELDISLGALHTYCNRLHKKMPANDRVGLILKVVRFVLTNRACH